MMNKCVSFCVILVSALIAYSCLKHHINPILLDYSSLSLRYDFKIPHQIAIDSVKLILLI